MNEHSQSKTPPLEDFGEGLLDRIADVDFAISLGVISSPDGARRWMANNEVVKRLQKAIQLGTLSEATIREFTEKLLIDFKRGERFPHEVALGAVAVALEPVPIEFAEEYLLDLARLQIVEMPLAPRIARICMTRRSQLPKVHSKKEEAFTAVTGRRSRLSSHLNVIAAITLLSVSSTVVHGTVVLPRFSESADHATP